VGDIAEAACEYLGDEADAAALRTYAEQFTAEALVALSDEEKTWPVITDCDRVDAAFQHLEAHGIVARQDFSCCQTYPIEIEALARAYGGVRLGTCAVGSVKSNFGHLVEAAGIAGLIKTVASLEHAQIPPTVHYRDPNPQINFAGTPFYVADRLLPWRADAIRRAGVSAFGIGGTNAHAVLESWSPPEPSHGPAHVELLTLSAESAEALSEMRAALADWLKIHIEVPLGDVAFTLNTGRQPFRHRWACVARTKPEVLRALGDEDHADAPAGWSVAHVADLLPPRARLRPTLPLDRGALQELATRWSRGERIDWRPLYESRTVRRTPLPTYPFQRKRFWLDPPARTVGPRGFGPWLGQAAAAEVHGPEERSELLLLAGETDALLGGLWRVADGRVAVQCAVGRRARFSSHLRKRGAKAEHDQPVLFRDEPGRLCRPRCLRQARRAHHRDTESSAADRRRTAAAAARRARAGSRRQEPRRRARDVGQPAPRAQHRRGDH
jgi:hypothetical protein